METRELRIEIPDRYEIDKEHSTFEKIVFKPIKKVNTWEDLESISGTVIDGYSALYNIPNDVPVETNKNIYLNEKYAKSALALAQLSQVLPHYNSNVNWNNDRYPKYAVHVYRNTLQIVLTYCEYYPFAFKTESEAKRFMLYNEQLLKQYFML